MSAPDPEQASAQPTPAPDQTPTTTSPVQPRPIDSSVPLPHTIGNYRILGLIGAGGMGTVYRAEQAHPRRIVALKVLTAGRFSSEKSRARFFREIELTASLEHPHIARVYDSGADQGICYYTMELIEGVPLDEYVRQAAPSTARILELVRLVCQAVQYAHQKGVIHRDLKPSNILVSADGQPHVLDFGLAKTLHSPSGVNLSLEGEIAGTPVYMSPEQACGQLDRIDTRSDVYSLGVIVFHLLTGRFPHDVDGSALQIMQRIREQEPRPLRTGQSHADRELGAILSKALARDPERRYAVAGALAADLDRYLKGEPLEAQPPTMRYLLTRWMRRRRLPLGMAAAVGLILAGMAVWSYVRIAKERDRALAATVEKEKQRLAAESARDAEARERGNAQRQHAAAREVNRFLIRILQTVDPYLSQGRDVTMREVLDRAAAQLASSITEQPAIRAEIEEAVGLMYRVLGRGDEALEHCQAALRLWRSEFPGDHPQVARGMSSVGLCLAAMGRRDESLPLYRDSLAMRQRLFRGDHPDVAQGLGDLAVCLQSLGQINEAMPLYQASLAMNRRLFSGDHLAVAMSMNNLAFGLRALGKTGEALPLYQEGLEMLQRLFEGDSPDVALGLNNVASSLEALGKSQDALELHLEAMEMRRRLFKSDHPAIASSMNNVGACLNSLGRTDEALGVYQQSLEMIKRLYTGDHPDVARTMNNLAGCLWESGRHDEGERLCRQSVEMRRRLYKGDHPDLANGLGNLAVFLAESNKMDEAIPLMTDAVAMSQRLVGAVHPRTRAYRQSLEQMLKDADRPLPTTRPMP